MTWNLGNKKVGEILHLNITFQSEKGVRLPIHYNLIIQGLIYNNISADLSEFLHKSGFLYEKRQFKHFTFSRIIGNYRFDKVKGEIFFPDNFSLIVASPIDEFCRELGNILLFADTVNVNGVKVSVEDIKITKPKVTQDTIKVTMLSPAVAYSTFVKPEGGKYTCYYHPKEKEFERQLDANLRKKYYSLYQKEAPDQPVVIDSCGKVKQNIVKYKGTVIKGHTCRLWLNGPVELLQIALESGLHSKNSQGFGCIELCPQNTSKEVSTC